MNQVALCAFAALCAAEVPAAAQAGRSNALKDCAQPALGPAECGVLVVAERDGSPRQIALDLVILRANGPRRSPDPIVVLQGGPGQPATQQADFYARTFAALRSNRDIYLLDARGTGQSHSLHCAIGEPSKPDFLPPESVARCREELARKVDLSAYATRQVVADLERLRTRFGLPAVNLYGTSYGTRLALEYLRLHPGSIRTATLSGVVPAQNDAPTDYGRFAQAAFERYVKVCRASPTCASAYPNPAEDLGRARRSVAAAFAAGSTTLSPGLFGELARMELYSPQRVPFLFKGLREAAAGNLSFWESRARRLAGFWSPEALSLGTFLSVTCADFMPRVDLARARRRGAGTFAGSYRAEQQAAACAVWKVPPTPSKFSSPVHSNMPILLLSGEYDPVTPPEWGELAKRTLPRARHVVFRNSGHGLGPAAGCAVSMMATLLDTRDAKLADSRCAELIEMPSLAGD